VTPDPFGRTEVGGAEKAARDNLRVQYGTLEERWRVVSREAEEWGELLENVHPEMEKFQVLIDMYIDGLQGQ